MKAELPTTSISWPAKVDLFGVLVSPTTYGEMVRVILGAGSERQPAVVSCHAVHALVTASDDSEFREQVNTFEAITPDGQPVRWALNWFHRANLDDRVYGPELMLRICQAASSQGVSIYLYGGTPSVLERLSANLVDKYPGLEIAGIDAPPFRELTAEEDQAVVERIRDSGAGIVFIGLGCPKQDRFAFHHRARIRAVQVCVGAAFDFHAGVKAVAPKWMQNLGLEWLFRLAQEPKRLWKRYFLTNFRFILKCLLTKRAPHQARVGSPSDGNST